MIGTEYLMIILLWCGHSGRYPPLSEIIQCRTQKIECVRKLKNFTTDDVVDKCLVGGNGAFR